MREIIFWLCVLVAGLGFAEQCKGEDDYIEDYSNDFEYQMAEEYSSIPTVQNFDIVSPSDRVFNVIEKQKERQIRDEIYRRQKYTYRPYSPNKRQHREMTKTDD